MNISELKRQRDEAIDGLYMMRGGERVPKLAEHYHREKLAEINQAWENGLQTIMRQAEEKQAAATAVLQINGNPFNAYLYLSDAELDQARRLSEFVRADFTGLSDANEITSLMRAAVATGDKVITWLAARHGAAAYQVAEFHPAAATEYRHVLQQVETAVMPPDALQAITQARQDVSEAQEAYRLAEGHTDAYKLRMGDAYGINPALLPEPA